MAYADGDPMKQKGQLAPIPRDQCGMALAADLIGDRWTLLILREALYGVMRFDAMQADLGAPRTILSNRLKKLCAIGVLTKRPYKEPGSRTRYQYALTSKGVDLALPLIALMQWGDKHCREGDATAAIKERSSGALCQVGLVTEDGRPTQLSDTRFQVNA